MKKSPQKNILFVLFGATGDLALKKIFPALEALYAEGALGDDPHIVAVGRREWGDIEFLDFLRAESSLSSADFLARISYSKVDIEAGKGYGQLSAKLARQGLSKREVLYYTSLAPMLHPKAILGLRDAGLLRRSTAGRSGGKILIEKPFGTDQKTACELDAFLASFLGEEQVYRVDHYLGKDTVKAIMDLHESTASFDALLTSESVSRIKVRMFEEKGIDGRGASYDGVGAFRDVGQNHILEMLAVIAAEIRKGKKDWQRARAAVLERLVPPIKTCALSRRGQYQGYLGEKGVAADSETETAFEVVTNFSSGKLAGVPLILEAGKKMGVAEALIEVEFKDISGLPKRMIFNIQPRQEIVTENRDSSRDAFDIPRTRDAYGNVIYAALQGDRREFVGREEIEALWDYADHVVACWNKVPLEKYGNERPFLLD